ncbi:hypothetical protein [Curtobacterium sp. MCBA15_001]|uniref:hypothetical protein n=1 Tax=Curtobacterium sp. MCBA15_001 TaxID=1898731 RepID=UPI00111415D6|nr:hypothetical protein [Curtobacterium sp. MCBA15_001]
MDPTGIDATGSAQSQGGQSLDAARQQLQTIPGLSNTSVDVDETISGLNKHHQVLVAATFDDSAKLPTMIDTLAQIGWSVNEHEPDTGVYVRLRLSPQPVIGEVAKAHGWPGAAYATSTDSLKQLVLLPQGSLRDRFGQWPGSAPEATG